VNYFTYSPRDGGQSPNVAAVPSFLAHLMAAPAQEPIYPIPPPVLTAAQFIEDCNAVMGLRGFPIQRPYGECGGVEILEQELHPAQEVAFRRACAVLAGYFRLNQYDYEEAELLEPVESEHPKSTDTVSADISTGLGMHL